MTISETQGASPVMTTRGKIQPMRIRISIQPEDPVIDAQLMFLDEHHDVGKGRQGELAKFGEGIRPDSILKRVTVQVDAHGIAAVVQNRLAAYDFPVICGTMKDRDRLQVWK